MIGERRECGSVGLMRLGAHDGRVVDQRNDGAHRSEIVGGGTECLGELRRKLVSVSHGGTIRWLSAAVLGYNDRRSARIRGLGNGGAVSFDAVLEDGELVFSGFHRLDGATPDLDDPND